MSLDDFFGVGHIPKQWGSNIVYLRAGWNLHQMKTEAQRARQKNSKICVVFHNLSMDILEKIKWLHSAYEVDILLAILSKPFFLESNLVLLGKEWIKKLRFYAPYPAGKDHYRFDELNLIIEQMRTRFPDITGELSAPVYVFNPEAGLAKEKNLDNYLVPKLESRVKKGGRLLSFIIPVYNNKNHLLRVLHNLLEQTLDRSHFEVIVVDDGSTDNCEFLIQEFIRVHKGQINFRYLYMSREKARRMGGLGYRAGAARNLGVKCSQGEIICFLDSDILVAPEWGKELLGKHELYDLIQPKRWQLKLMKSFSELIKFQDFNLERDISFRPSGYWESFQKQTRDWSLLSNRWKYVSTFCLSLKKRDLINLGLFNPTFCRYGFEDTDLGWRAYMAGLQFHLSPSHVYHLHHPLLRSEFFHWKKRKAQLLCKSAPTFYLNHLHPYIYKEIGHFLR